MPFTQPEFSGHIELILVPLSIRIQKIIFERALPVRENGWGMFSADRDADMNDPTDDEEEEEAEEA